MTRVSLLLLTSLVSFHTALSDGVSFRAQNSFIQYEFSATMSFIGTILTLEFSTTSCLGDLVLITSRDTDQFYLVSLEDENRIKFYYKLNDGQFNVELLAPQQKTFCDGQRHKVEFKRYGRSVLCRIDGGQEKKNTEMGIKTAIFSKPDKILLGGSSGKKFDGCIIDAQFIFQWKNESLSVNPITSFLKSDPNIKDNDVFAGACSSRETQQG